MDLPKEGDRRYFCVPFCVTIRVFVIRLVSIVASRLGGCLTVQYIRVGHFSVDRSLTKRAVIRTFPLQGVSVRYPRHCVAIACGD